MFENALTKYGGIVLGSLLSAVVWCTPEFIFDKKDSELLAALIIGLLGQTVIVINNMAELKIQNEKTQKEELSKVVDLLKVHNDYFSNEWLFSVLTRISQVHRMSANKPYDLMRIKKTINDSLDSCFRLVNVPFEYKIPSGELGRIVKLNEAVSLAQNTIFAVTVDKGNYFDEFWQPLNNDYIKLNVEAGLKGVRVERIFILTKERLQLGTSKNLKFLQIVEQLKKGGALVKLYSIEIDKISNLDILSSFLIIDDVFVSEADKNGTDMGYIAINDSKRVEDLLLKFNGLKHIGVSV